MIRRDFQIREKICLEMIDWVLQMTHASGTLMEENGHLVFNKDLLENRDETSKEGRSYEMFVEAFGLLLTILAGQIGGLSPGFCDTILNSELFWVLLAVLAIPEIGFTADFGMTSSD